MHFINNQISIFIKYLEFIILLTATLTLLSSSLTVSNMFLFEMTLI